MESADSGFGPLSDYESTELPDINKMQLEKGATEYRETRLASISSISGANGRRPSTTEDVFYKLSAAVPDLSQLTADAKAATHAEHCMTIFQGLRLYPKAVGWSALLSLAIVMEGYDTILLGQFFALPEFKKRFGEPTGHGYEISTPWQSGLTNGASVGEILGLFLNGILAERYGYRICMLSSLVAITCFIFIAFFSVSKEMLLVAEILCGIPWGVFQTLTTTYAAEVMPVALRAYLTTYVNLCWITGQLIGSCVLRGFVNNSTEWSYRVPFALQWFWAIPLLIGVWFAPESPWWLVRHGRLEDAKQSLLRLTSTKGSSSEFNVLHTLAMMRHTDELEKSISKGESYLDCFKGSELRRTEISCMVWAIQIFCGSPLFIYSAYFLVQAGIPSKQAFDLSIGQYGVGFMATVSAWGLVNVCGRRTLYLWGIGAMFIILLSIGTVGTQPISKATSWSTAALLILFTFVYDLTVGPVCYSLVPEIPSTRMRIKTTVLARVTYNLAFQVANVIMPKMLNPTALNWRGKVGYFWAGLCLLSFAWAYFRLPEPKGLTFCELDILFEHKANARKFRRFQVILEETGYFSVENEDEGRAGGGRTSSVDFGR